MMRAVITSACLTPLRATDGVAIGFYAIRFPYRPLLCCEGRFSDGLFSAIAARDAVKGDGALRRCSNGLALQYRSTIRNRWSCAPPDARRIDRGVEDFAVVLCLQVDHDALRCR